jgi:transcriptional regulator with XRE-family HTH domain
MDMGALLGRNLRRHRSMAGLSQAALAEATGLDRTYISGVERGIRNPTVRVLHCIAASLGIQAADLLDLEADPDGNDRAEKIGVSQSANDIGREEGAEQKKYDEAAVNERATEAPATIFDLNELAWMEPATDDEREAARRRRPGFILWPPLPDHEALGLLRQILDLRRRWLRSENAGASEEQRTLYLAAQLMEGIAGWAAAEQLHLSYTDVALARETHVLTGEDPAFHRRLARKSLAFPLPLMPTSTRREIADAMDQLFDRNVRPILQPPPNGGRGIAPRRRAEIQLTLLAWVEWQVARGCMGREPALAEVARACGLGSHQAARNWKTRLDRGFGQLARAKEVGRKEAASERLSNHPEERLAAYLRSLKIAELGKEYRFVSRSRTDEPTDKPLRKQAT